MGASPGHEAFSRPRVCFRHTRLAQHAALRPCLSLPPSHLAGSLPGAWVHGMQLLSLAERTRSYPSGSSSPAPR